MTDRSHGDLAVQQLPDVVEPRRRALVDAPWTWLRQVHGAEVVVVDRPGAHVGEEADAACTRVSGAPLAVQVADCAPIALVAESGGGIAVVHAGWRGLALGIVDAASAALRAIAGPAATAVVGPCIRPDSYEFGASDLDDLVGAFGETVRGRTRDGAPAFDLPAAVGVALERNGVTDVTFVGGCTADTADRHWSHRARADAERQALVAWISARAGAS